MLHEPDPVGVDVETNEKVGGVLRLPVIPVVEVVALSDSDDGPFPLARAPLVVNGRNRIASVGDVKQSVSGWRLGGHRRERRERHQQHSSQDRIAYMVHSHFTFLRRSKFVGALQRQQ